MRIIHYFSLKTVLYIKYSPAIIVKNEGNSIFASQLKILCERTAW